MYKAPTNVGQEELFWTVRSAPAQVWIQRGDPPAIVALQSPPELARIMGDQLQY